jgi:transglutaminase-like putative cysteine protease
MTQRHVRRLLCISTAALVMLSGTTLAQNQPARPPRGTPPRPTPVPVQPTQPAPAQPAAPAAPGQPAQPAPAQPAVKQQQEKPAPTVGPYIRQDQQKELKLTVHISLRSDQGLKQTYRDPFSGETVQMPVIQPFEYETIGIVFPLVPSTAGSLMFEDDYTGVLTVNDLVVDEEPKVLSGYPAGVKLARWDAQAPQGQIGTCRQVELQIDMPMRCFNTTFDETGAARVAFPNTWPAEAESALRPQLYVELGVDGSGVVRPYDDKLVTDTLAAWLAEEGVTDPRRLAPILTAKLIAGKIWANTQVSGEGMVFVGRTAELAGLLIQPPAATLESRKGSEHDVTALAAAMFRKAGLPVRTVIGYDVGRGDAKFLQKGSKSNRLRSWVEFALYDEQANTLNWVPVDVARMRKTTNRPPRWEQPWKYFGTHDELSGIAPFALQFHPPTDVVAYGSPGFWGWFVTPAAPGAAEQALRFTAAAMSKRGGEPAREPRKRDRLGD